MPRYEKGVGLIEVLVAVLVLATGLLGMLALQSMGLQSAASSHQRSQAVTYANDILDRMRVNRDAAIADAYALAGGAVTAGQDCTNPGAPCSTVQLASADLDEWTTNLGVALPGGRAWISRVDNTITVQVGWNDERRDGVGALDCDTGLPCITVVSDI